MRCQKDLRTVKKGVNRIENQEENWCQIHQNCQMRYFVENFTTLIIVGTKDDREIKQRGSQ